MLLGLGQARLKPAGEVGSEESNESLDTVIIFVNYFQYLVQFCFLAYSFLTQRCDRFSCVYHVFCNFPEISYPRLFPVSIVSKVNSHVTEYLLHKTRGFFFFTQDTVKSQLPLNLEG